MKDRKTKEKKHESTIGKIIYGFLLFMPLMAIGVTSLVSTFNMSAKQESEIIYKYETNDVNDVNDLVDGNIYHFLYTSSIEETCRIGVKEYFISDELLTSDLGNQNDAYDISIRFNTFGVSYFFFYPYDTTASVDRRLICFNTEFDFIYDSSLTVGIEYCYQFISKCNNIPIESVITHNVESQEVFYKAIDKVQQSPLFNWAQNSIIYTGMNNFTTSLSITTPFIPLLMTYWLIISVVYFLYDIVLIILVVLHKKIHYLEESI